MDKLGTSQTVPSYPPAQEYEVTLLLKVLTQGSVAYASFLEAPVNPGTWPMYHDQAGTQGLDSACQGPSATSQ